MGSYKKHRVSKGARKAHKKRAQKRKAAFGGLAAFCETHPQSRNGGKRMGKLG